MFSFLLNIRVLCEHVLFMSAQNGKPASWDEIRIAYTVARLGTLSAAADYLGIHHATVIRHIDILEARLGCILFHRHPRGYTPTEAGNDLMKIGAITDETFKQMEGRLRGQRDDVSGELIVTTLDEISSPLTLLLVEFQQLYPNIQMAMIEDERVLKLEYGEAHVALRAGKKSDEQDNIVQELTRLSYAPYAHRNYVSEHGLLRGIEDISNHRFVVRRDGKRAPFNSWLKRYVDPNNVSFRSTDNRSHKDAIMAGAGIGFLNDLSCKKEPNMVQMLEPKPDWTTPIWLVTHVSLHRTAKVQALLSFLKERMKNWN